ncbi:hypothetical protein E3P77_00850 [Wallemia ichthyophaga]|nr:hypothetical protein E3P97_01631 [Wallemia ichthyophaga]TIA94966.1 hypothetical protein E3P96_03966 [Wallemia ichthyophaga]TIB33683.1 hypothetical protein E3P85_01283 [Wallemia ichthyophaga]TIB47741.1 hypothetical protein E3P82_01629 [Wallemia ichthyophaga]TIB51987.1 hypothetical protein E3P81_01630 [Wallemia ichthyophaga]
MASNAQFEEMVAMMNREREKEKKKLFYAEDKEKTETVIKNDWGFLVNPKQRKEDATPLASVKYMSKTKL